MLGVGISALNLDLAETAVAQALERKTKGYICVTGVHGVSEAQHDPAFRAILNHSFLTTPDGMPTVWMGRWQGFRHMRRVYGPDLMLRVCEFTQRRGFTHFLYGGAPGIADALKAQLEQRFPGLKILWPRHSDLQLVGFAMVGTVQPNSLDRDRLGNELLGSREVPWNSDSVINQRRWLQVVHLVDKALAVVTLLSIGVV